MCSYNRINDVYGCGNDAHCSTRAARAARLHRLRAVRLGRGAPDHRPVLRHRHRAARQRGRYQQLRRGAASTRRARAAPRRSPRPPTSRPSPATARRSGRPRWTARCSTSCPTMNNAGPARGHPVRLALHRRHAVRAAAPGPGQPAAATFATAQAHRRGERHAAEERRGAAADAAATWPGNGGTVLVMGPTAIAPYIGGGGSAHVTPYDPAPARTTRCAAAGRPRAKLQLRARLRPRRPASCRPRRCPRPTRPPATPTGR